LIRRSGSIRFARRHADNLTDDGGQRLVRHGHLPERKIVTGIGPVAVRCPRVRDRCIAGCPGS
jgi:putative transposase